MERNKDHLGDISVDDIYRVLGNRERRALLDLLRETERTTVPELADDLAAVSNSTEGRTRGDETARVRLRLHHAHLPKLDEVGLIEYEAESRTVVPNETIEVAHTLMDSGLPGR